MGTASGPAGDNSPQTVSGSAKVYFAGYTVDLRSGELSTGGKKIYLQQQPLEVLRMLLESHGEMVTREELRERLWPTDTFVDFDHGLNKAVLKLRTALGDSAETAHFVETVPRRGYRFVGPVSETPQSPDVSPTWPALKLASPARYRRVTLAGFAAALALLIALFGYVAVPIFRSRPNPQPVKLQRLAVLPFENLSGDPDQEYFSDGMTEEMIAYLTRFEPSRLAVIARTTAMAYKGTRKTAADIGRELEVDYILEGSVRRDAGRVRITAQLIQVHDQSHLWAEIYEREMSGIFPVQKDIAANVAHEIGLKLTGSVPSARFERKVRPEAHEEFLRGLYLWHKSGPQTLESLKHFQSAIALQPDYAPAYAWLAFAYNRLASGEILPPSEAYPLAQAAALKAIEIDPALPEGHAALGFILRSYNWDWKGAESELQKALQADPNSPTANHVYGLYLSTVGRHKEAIEAMMRAAELDPLSPLIASNRAVIYANARQYNEAATVWQKHQNLIGRSSKWWGHFLLVRGSSKQALAEFEADHATVLTGNNLAGRAQAYANMGRPREARAILRKLEAQPRARAIYSPYIARVYAALGEPDEAFRWLEIALEERAPRLIYLKVDPAWDSMRGDARFNGALRRMNLTD